MKKLNYLLMLLVVVILAGCATTKEKAVKWFTEHPQDAAGYCAYTYPPRDSVGEAVTMVPADNKDYTGQIDSLGDKIDDLNTKLEQDSIKAAAGGQISAQELSNYKSQVSTLKKDYAALKSSYVPCKPEIRQITVYRENTAKVIAQQLALNQLQDKYNDLEKNKEEADDLAKHRLWALIAAGILIVILAYKLLKK